MHLALVYTIVACAVRPKLHQQKCIAIDQVQSVCQLHCKMVVMTRIRFSCACLAFLRNGDHVRLAQDNVSIHHYILCDLSSRHPFETMHRLGVLDVIVPTYTSHCARMYSLSFDLYCAQYAMCIHTLDALTQTSSRFSLAISISLSRVF